MQEERIPIVRSVQVRRCNPATVRLTHRRLRSFRRAGDPTSAADDRLQNFDTRRIELTPGLGDDFGERRCGAPWLRLGARARSSRESHPRPGRSGPQAESARPRARRDIPVRPSARGASEQPRTHAADRGAARAVTLLQRRGATSPIRSRSVGRACSGQDPGSITCRRHEGGHRARCDGTRAPPVSVP